MPDRKENTEPTPADENSEDTKVAANEHKVSEKLKDLRPAIWGQRKKINQIQVTLREAEEKMSMATTRQEKEQGETEKQKLLARIAAEQKALKELCAPLHRTSVVRAYFIR